MFEAVRQDGYETEHAAPERKAEFIVLESVKQNGDALQHATPGARLIGPELVLEAVKQKEHLLSLVAPEIVLEAVKQNGDQQSTRRIVREAVKQREASQRIVLEAVKQKVNSLQHTTPEHKVCSESARFSEAEWSYA